MILWSRCKTSAFPGASSRLAIHATFFIHPENCARTCEEKKEDTQERGSDGLRGREFISRESVNTKDYLKKIEVERKREGQIRLFFLFWHLNPSPIVNLGPGQITAQCVRACVRVKHRDSRALRLVYVTLNRFPPLANSQAAPAN